VVAMMFVVKNDSIILLASAAVVRVSDNSNCISSITVRVQLYEIIYGRGIDQNEYFSSMKKNPMIQKIEKTFSKPNRNVCILLYQK